MYSTKNDLVRVCQQSYLALCSAQQEIEPFDDFRRVNPRFRFNQIENMFNTISPATSVEGLNCYYFKLPTSFIKMS